jgi:hypothetical protein
MNKCYFVDPGDQHEYLLLVVAPSVSEARKFGDPLEGVRFEIASKCIPNFDPSVAGAWKIAGTCVPQH